MRCEEIYIRRHKIIHMDRLMARCEAVISKAQGESLVFDVRAIAPGTKIPVYDIDLKPVLVDGVQKVFEADEEFLKRSVALFDGGHLNRDHLTDTDFGDLTKAFYDGGLCFSGMCSSPDGIELISGGKYNGWSIEGEFVATDEGDALKPTRLSLLTEKDPACPSNRCDTLRMALAAWDGSAATDRLIKYATDEEGNIIQKSKISKYFLEVEGDGTKKGDYGWPIGDIKDGEPAYDEAGLMAAYKAASGARGATKDESKIKKIKSIYKSEGWELPAGLQGQAAATVEGREDWNQWGNFSIRGKDDESVSLHCYLPDIDFGDFGDGTEIKLMDVVDAAKYKLLAQYIVNTVLGVASGNQGAVVMASKPEPGEPGTVDPFASIKEKFGVESEDELKTLIEHGRKYGDVTTKLDGIKAERDELRTVKAELETNLTTLQERQRQRDIAEAKEKVKTAFVPGLWEGEIEEEAEGGEKVKVAKVDRMAEDYVKDPAGFYTANRTFALAERPLEPKTRLQGSAASVEADELLKKQETLRNKTTGIAKRAGRG
jgi:hypothetical protein